MIIKANYVNIPMRSTYPVAITIVNNIVVSITPIDEPVNNYILPGFVDAHIHIESSMLVPTAFSAIAVQHGTVATISDPHEIANVCGIAGIDYMIDNAKKAKVKFHFGAPSCVPATPFEAAGAVINSNDIKTLMQRPEIFYLSEVMNYPGVLYKDAEVMQKIAYAKQSGKPIDGHAPGLTGTDAITYINAGITTDHECFTYEEAKYKLDNGMKLLVREGSAAKNFAALEPLIDTYWENMMFCCDDKHPDELMLHHINHHVQRAIAAGNNVYKVLQMACINPVKHYNMQVGLLQVGDSADAIIVKDLKDFEVVQTIINGETVFTQGTPVPNNAEPTIINNFNCSLKTEQDFEIQFTNQKNIRVIEALDGQLITNEIIDTPTITNRKIVSNITKDILQISVVNRYTDAPVANGFIKNFGLQQGAIASTVGHDCHNIIAVGVDAIAITAAVNAVIQCKGGIAVAQPNTPVMVMPLPIAGIITNQPAPIAAQQYQALDAAAKQLGCTLTAPFMTLSFMALPVIPNLKMYDKGMFDGIAFADVPVAF